MVSSSFIQQFKAVSVKSGSSTKKSAELGCIWNEPETSVCIWFITIYFKDKTTNYSVYWQTRCLNSGKLRINTLFENNWVLRAPDSMQNEDRHKTDSSRRFAPTLSGWECFH